MPLQLLLISDDLYQPDNFEERLRETYTGKSDIVRYLLDNHALKPKREKGECVSDCERLQVGPLWSSCPRQLSINLLAM